MTANIEPDYYDTHNGQIDWTVENDRCYNSAYNSGSFTGNHDVEDGETSTLAITIPPVPAAPPVTIVKPYQDGRAWNPLAYRITAQVGIENMPIPAMARYLAQDEIDTLRQQYIDMDKREIPPRAEFRNEGQSQHNHFCLRCGRIGDGACKCGRHDYHLWSIMENLEVVLTKLNEELGITDTDKQITELRINSGYRCPIRNTAIGRPELNNLQGAKNSEHIYGIAADVVFEDWNNDGSFADDKQALIKAGENAGARVLPDYPGHVHMNW